MSHGFKASGPIAEAALASSAETELGLPGRIPSADLRFLDVELSGLDFEIDLVYANADHPLNNFGQIYRKSARMIGHRTMVEILVQVCGFCTENFGWKLRLLDCLRPREAQELMLEAFPLPKSLLSQPGSGGHARGMAIDLQPMKDGVPVDFGSSYDDFSKEGLVRAHRDFMFLSEPARVRNGILANRHRLDRAFAHASGIIGIPIDGVLTEWWDYRIPNSISAGFAPVSDEDLPNEMRMVS